jgi:hypothetical protein
MLPTARWQAEDASARFFIRRFLNEAPILGRKLSGGLKHLLWEG